MKAFKFLFTFVSILILLSSCQEQSQKGRTNTKAYNQELALKLEADQYGMSSYVMAFLKRGPNRGQDSLTAANLQKAHLENIMKMAEEGTLVLAGPFMDDGDIRGIYIFNVATVEEAKKLTESDPAIKAGRLVMELHPWYGSAAIKEINSIHNQLTKQSIAE
ncbi:hypothetical protein DWB61_05590 [Ancylomarina euxinus]|uniref:YCII-related domain-containing protein n=1 Tax=Ancylomarina euxinus TaxID=2283627 RepID=A0A425Y3V7_9BACT|nr:YciI family protein [Ancylomarina euxinus]MCZ4694508.1 YciI family protein [Ancylomarina euxinus]MUP14051.1 hypothetical protein [Ancylomarina euxinus]RRG22912.1 hypothetical protein DWB61_05590 [Ancylomarina euxinus]